MPFDFLRRGMKAPAATRSGGATGSDPAAARGEAAIRFDGLTDEWRLTGTMHAEGRLSDLLNRRESIAISDVFVLIIRPDQHPQRHRGGSAEHRRQQIDPDEAEIAQQYRGRQRARGIHAGATDRAGEHRLQSDHAAHGDAGHHAGLFRPGRDVENHQHQDHREHGFQRERLPGRSGWNRRAQRRPIAEHRQQRAAGAECAQHLRRDVRRDF